MTTTSDLLAAARAAGLTITVEEVLAVSGPAEAKARYADQIRQHREQILAQLRQPASGARSATRSGMTTRPRCCRGGPGGCDHVWCSTCGRYANDTGNGPSCHPRHTIANCLWQGDCWIRHTDDEWEEAVA